MKYYIATRDVRYRTTTTETLGVFDTKLKAKKFINNLIREDNPWSKGKWENNNLRETYDDDVTKQYWIEDFWLNNERKI